MLSIFRWTAGSVAVAALSGGIVWMSVPAQVADAATSAGLPREELLLSQTLTNAPRLKLTSALVTYAPGEKAAPHHHAGSVYAYVLSGEIRSRNSGTGPVKVFHKGESFFEPAGTLHMISENASAIAPATVLEVVVADQTASALTTPE